MTCAATHVTDLILRETRGQDSFSGVYYFRRAKEQGPHTRPTGPIFLREHGPVLANGPRVGNEPLNGGVQQDPLTETDT